MTSNFQALSRNKPHQNLIAWYSNSVATPNCLVIYGRDDSNRDLLIEVEGAQRGLSFLEALSNHKYRFPFIVSHANIWYYDQQRQLCASVPTSSKLGIATSIPERSWKFEVFSTQSLATWEPKGSEDERCDFFLIRTPDPSAWILKTAQNGNDYSQITFKVSTGKVILQVWHRQAAEDVPQLTSPKQYPENVRVAITNVNIKLLGPTTVTMNTTCWTNFIKLDDDGPSAGFSRVPPEVLCVEVSALDLVEDASRGLEETALPKATMWVDEGVTQLASQSLQRTQSLQRSKQTPKKAGQAEIDTTQNHEFMEMMNFDEHVEEVSQKCGSQKKEKAASPKSTKTKIKKSIVQSQDDEVGFFTLPTGEEKKRPKTAEKKKPEKIYESPSLNVGEVFSTTKEPSKTKGTSAKGEDGHADSKAQTKKVGAPKGTPFPQGKKGTDFIGKRVTVKGKGEGVVQGGGAKMIRIVFDVDAAMKTDSLVSIDKVSLL